MQEGSAGLPFTWQSTKLLRNHYPAVAIFNNGQANKGRTEEETEIGSKTPTSFLFISLSLSSRKNKDVNRAAEVYNSKEQFSALVNGWEVWEPNDKTWKDPIRTKWRREDQDKKKKSGKDKIEEKWPLWENEEQGYASDLELNVEYDLDEITCKKVEQELVEYEEEELEDHDKKGWENKEEEAGREQEEDGSVGNDVDEDDEDDEDSQKSASESVREEKTKKHLVRS